MQDKTQEQLVDELTDQRPGAGPALTDKSLDPPDVSTLSIEDLRKLVHELHVHKIKLEMQNEQLRRTQLELGESRKIRENLESLWELSRIQNKDLKFLADHVLEEIKGISESRYAFYGFINHEETEMEIYSWSKEAMQQCKIDDQPRIFPIAKAGIWADCVRKRHTVIIDDYAQDHEGKLGLPDGHVSLTRFVSIPVFSGGKIVAVGAVANKESEYTEDDVKQLEAFLSHAQIMADQKRGQDALRESELKFRTVADFTYDWEYWISPDGALIYVSPSCERITGYSPDEFINDPGLLEKIVHPSHRSLDDHQLCSIDSGPPHKVDFPIVTRSGQTLWIEHSCQAVWSPDGRWLGRRVSCRDITDRKHAETTLQDSENHLRSVLETIPDALAIYDDLGRVTFINRAFEQLYEWRNEELAGKPLSNFVPPSEETITEQSWKRTLQGEKVVFETKRWTKEGKALDLQLSTGILSNMDGKHVASIVIHRDITARKREREEHHKSESMLSTILSTSPVGIALLQDRKFKWMNELGAKMLGFENQQELMGETTRIAYPSEEEYERVGKALYTDMQAGKIAETLAKFKRKDGSVFDASVRMKAVDPSMYGNLIVGAIADITDRIRTEQENESLRTQLFQSQKLEAMGTLVGGIAHDFNNMLAVILGYSQLLLNDIKKGELGYEDLQTIIRTGTEGAELVKKLLAFGQQGQVIPVPLDLNQQISQLATLISRTLPQVVQVDINLTDEPTSIRADHGQIDQLVMNLAINASEAMPKGGSLKIATKAVSLDENYSRRHHGAKPGNYVMLSVSDTGRGMDKATLARIFDPFFSTKQRGSTKGTGLGLSVVKGIVGQQGGHVTCLSEPGKGTKFRAYFPAIIESPVMTEKAVAPSVQSTVAATILVVEDTPPVAELERRILEDAGYNVIVATNGQEGLDIYQTRKEEISMVILDLLMPEMSGRDCLVELVKIDPSVKVLIASGYSLEDELHSEISPLVKGFVHKPFAVADLLGSVASVLRDNL